MNPFDNDFRFNFYVERTSDDDLYGIFAVGSGQSLFDDMTFGSASAVCASMNVLRPAK